jgi:hypothetical protein
MTNFPSSEPDMAKESKLSHHTTALKSSVVINCVEVELKTNISKTRFHHEVNVTYNYQHDGGGTTNPQNAGP